MSLAIVIPYYNIHFFDKTLFSLSCQTDKRFKVYIGNNNSPNDPMELIDHYKDGLDITYKVFRNERDPRLLSNQFMQCLSLISDEEWFMILGDDDMLDSDVVAEFYRNLPQVEAEGLHVIKFSSALLNEYDEIISNAFSLFPTESSTELFFNKIIKGKVRSSLSEHIFRTSQYTKYKIPQYSLAWHSDDMMIMQYSDFKNIACISDSVVFIRFSSKSISGQTKLYIKEKKEASIDFYSDLLFRYHKEFDNDQLRTILGQLFSFLLMTYNPFVFYKYLHYGIDLLGTECVRTELLKAKYTRDFSLKKLDLSHIPNVTDFYINTYYFQNRYPNPDKFSDRHEFRFIHTTMNDIEDKDFYNIINRSVAEEDDAIILCFGPHHFSPEYSKNDLYRFIYLACYYNADVLFGGGDGIDSMFEIQNGLYWVNRVEKSNFIILFKKVFPLLLGMRETNNPFMTVLNSSSDKMIVSPFFSI